MAVEKFSITSLLEPFKTSPVEAFHNVQLGEDPAALSRCKSVSVSCLSPLQRPPFGVRWSEGERSEPSAAEPKRGDAAPFS